MAGKSDMDSALEAVQAASRITDVRGGEMVIAGLIAQCRVMADLLAQVDESLFWLVAQSNSLKEAQARAAYLRERLAAYSRR